MRPHILVTKKVFPETIAFLEQHANVDYQPADEGLTPEELMARARGKQAILSQITDAFSRDVLARLQGLGVRMIAHMGVGYDNIDVPAATGHGILVVATIRAQPLETLPQPESCARQRGAHSRTRIVFPLIHHWRAAGERPVVHPEETRRCRKTRISSASFALA